VPVTALLRPVVPPPPYSIAKDANYELWPAYYRAARPVRAGKTQKESVRAARRAESAYLWRSQIGF